MPLNNAGSQIAFGAVAYNKYAVIVIGQVKQDLSENTTFCHSASQRLRSYAYCSLKIVFFFFVDNGRRLNGKRTTIPALKK